MSLVYLYISQATVDDSILGPECSSPRRGLWTAVRVTQTVCRLIGRSEGFGEAPQNPLFFSPQEPQCPSLTDPVIHHLQHSKQQKHEKCLNHSTALSILLLINSPVPMSDLISSPGYLHWIRRHGITIFKTVGLKMWGNGSCESRSLEAGALVFGEANLITQSCFVTGTRGLARLLLGKGDEA